MHYRTFRFSKIQWLLPSSSTWFHHLRPTSRRPVMFLTVQKSIDSSTIIMTKMVIKLLKKKVAKRNSRIAADLNIKWKIRAIGCLKWFGFIRNRVIFWTFLVSLQTLCGLFVANCAASQNWSAQSWGLLLRCPPASFVSNFIFLS